jgi:CubicO group peptidase (beta-lactamase class C family)
LDAFLLDRAIARRMHGVSLVLVDGEARHERHVGFRDPASRTPPDGDTRYGIGSVTKLFTAACVHALAERGALRLDDPVATWLPELGGRVPSETTLGHLLAHASGLPALGFSESKMSDRWYMDGQPVGAWPDVAGFLAGAGSWATARPGQRWQYSNEGYLALGAVIERATGERYAAHVARTLLRPLGMDRSTFSREVVEADANRVAPTMRDDDGDDVPGANLYGPVPAAGGLVATPRDMAAFARLLLGAPPDAGAAPPLSAASLARMAEPQLPIDRDAPGAAPSGPLWDDPRRIQALGPQLVRGIPGVAGDAVGHGGGVMGGTAYLLVDRAAGRAVVALSNVHGYPLARLAAVALAALAGEPPTSLSFVRRELVTERVCGDYRAFRDTIRGEVRPAPGGVELTLAFRPARRRVPMTFLDHDDATGVTRLLAWGEGRPTVAEIVPTDDPDAPLELRFERYALRRRGRLPA